MISMSVYTNLVIEGSANLPFCGLPFVGSGAQGGVQLMCLIELLLLVTHVHVVSKPSLHIAF